MYYHIYLVCAVELCTAASLIYCTPPNSHHVISVNEEYRPEEPSDPNVVLLPNQHRQCFHVHHHKNYALHTNQRKDMTLHSFETHNMCWDCIAALPNPPLQSR